MYKPNWEKTGVEFYNELIDYVLECFHATEHMIDRKGFLLMNSKTYLLYYDFCEKGFEDSLFNFDIVVNDGVKHPICVIEVL